MFHKAIIAIVAAALVGTLFARTEAVARGGGSIHGGGISNFRAGGFFRPQSQRGRWGGAGWHGTSARDGVRSGHDERGADWRSGRSHAGDWQKSSGSETTGTSHRTSKVNGTSRLASEATVTSHRRLFLSNSFGVKCRSVRSHGLSGALRQRFGCVKADLRKLPIGYRCCGLRP